MGLKQDIKDKVSSILDEKFEVEEVSYVPDIANTKLTFGNKGLQFDGTVLHIDMRGSTEVLNKHNRPVVAKIHMAYFHTIVKIANFWDGEVRSFNGDSMLVFFQGATKTKLRTAVRAALNMKYMIDNSEGINPLLEKYTPIDFGIGIDYGSILCTKIGIGGDSNNKDLIWIGNAVNKAVKIGDTSQSPSHIGISSIVYENLDDSLKYVTEKTLWGDVKKDIWTSSLIEYNGQMETYYKTTYHIVVD